MAIHAARLEKSERLQRVLDVLARGKAMTTRQIVREAHVCAVSTIVSELRAQGVPITCERKGDRWWYSMQNPSSSALRAA